MPKFKTEILKSSVWPQKFGGMLVCFFNNITFLRAYNLVYVYVVLLKGRVAQQCVHLIRTRKRGDLCISC